MTEPIVITLDQRTLMLLQEIKSRQDRIEARLAALEYQQTELRRGIVDALDPATLLQMLGNHLTAVQLAREEATR